LNARQFDCEIPSQGEPPRQVVAEACPGSFYGCLQSTPTAELSQAAALLNPGMWKLGDLGSLPIDLLGLCGRHFGFECAVRCGFVDTRNRSSPGWTRVRRSTLAAQRAVHASCFSCVVNVRMYAMAAIYISATSQEFSSRTGE